VKTLKWLEENFEETLMVILLVAMSTVMMINVILRYIFHSGLIWADEFCRYTFIASCFIAAGFCIRKKSLMRMATLKDMLPKKAGLCLEAFIDLLFVVFFAYYSYTGITVIQQGLRNNILSTAMQMPMTVLYVIAMAGYLFALIRAFQKFIADSRGVVKKQEVGESE
jgi:TRAP-type C4-dicarboxylate transport system permease small subunit